MDSRDYKQDRSIKMLQALSIPLNGFILKSGDRILAKNGDTELSIPLNGFRFTMIGGTQILMLQ